MAVLRVSPTSVSRLPMPRTLNLTHMYMPMPLISPHPKPSSSPNTRMPKLFTALSSSPSIETTEPPDQVGTVAGSNKFDWYSNWYPIMPVCDLDKRVPHGKKVLGLDLVVWWDRNEKEWKVFDDSCPHRLAPLSEGRIDQLGRLQCVYHGWCFSGSGDCKLIPQAPPDGPTVHTSKRACVAVYPSIVQHDLVWFWPSTDPKHKEAIKNTKPPCIPELDNPSFTKIFGNRDVPYGYDVLIENILDPAHVPYAHYGIMRTTKPSVKVVDREGGIPMDISIKQLDVNGIVGTEKWGKGRFHPPCIYESSAEPTEAEGNGSPYSIEEKVLQSSAGGRKMTILFICVPVSPGRSRLIWVYIGLWIERIVPRWMYHLLHNLILDSDLYLLHAEERKIMEVGNANWHKACYVPTKSDAFVVAFRRWLNEYAGGRVDWRGKYSGGDLPPTPPREQLMDRYWTHVVNCRSCMGAYKWLNALEVALQIISIAAIGIVAVTKQGILPVAVRSALVSMALLMFLASKWLSHFIYTSFRFHDYNHALR